MCKHNYNLIKDYYIKSLLEEILDKGRSFSADTMPNRFGERTHIRVYKCEKCAKIREKITRV